MSELLLDGAVLTEEEQKAGSAPASSRPSQRDRPVPLEADAGTVDLLPSDRRRLRVAEAEKVAKELHGEPRLSERIEIYNRAGKQVIFLAAKRFPELMPMLGDEFEFLELTRADHDPD